MLWWSTRITIRGEHVLFLNLLKDEESPEDFKSEIDFIPTFNLHDDTEENIAPTGLAISNNSEPPTEKKEERTGFQLSRLLDELTLSTHNKDSYSESTKNADIFEENPAKTRKIGNLHVLNKKTTEQPTSKNDDTLFPIRSEEGGFAFINLCFDMIASLIQGVMKGLMSVGDVEVNPNPSEIPNSFNQNPSRIKKRDLSANENVLKTTKSLKRDANLSLDKTSTTPANVKQSADLQEQTITTSSLEPLITIIENDTTALKKNEKYVKVTDAKDINEHSKHILEESSNKDQLVTDTSTMRSSLPIKATNTTSLNLLATALDELTEEENSNALFMDDFFHKQDEILLPEVLQGQLATARFFSQPHEGEHRPENESKTGTVLIATGALLAIVVIASVGIAAAYKLQLFNIRRGRSGNRNSPSQRNTMA